MTRQVRIAKARRHRRSQVPLSPNLASGGAATATVTDAQLSPQEAAATLAALAGLYASWGLGSSWPASNKRTLADRAIGAKKCPSRADAFLNEVMGLRLGPAHVAALRPGPRGWAAGLELAALSARSHTNSGTGDRASPDGVAAFVEAFTGSHRFVLDYLVEEVLATPTRASARFLLDTSVLDQLTGGLCDALTGTSAGQQLLERLERDNLFLSPLDDQREWYRYHHLFGEALRSISRARELDLV